MELLLWKCVSNNNLCRKLRKKIKNRALTQWSHC
jgi:hypothetical protein